MIKRYFELADRVKQLKKANKVNYDTSVYYYNQEQYQRRHRKWALKELHGLLEDYLSIEAWWKQRAEKAEAAAARAEAKLADEKLLHQAAVKAGLEQSNELAQTTKELEQTRDELEQARERIKELEEALKREHGMRVDELGDPNETDCEVCRLLEAGDEPDYQKARAVLKEVKEKS